jgi:hypothetical protein
MTLEQIANLSDSVAAIAIVVSLVYLTIQVRQTGRNQRAMMQQARTDRGILLTQHQSAYMADLMVKLARDETDITPRELMVLVSYMRCLGLHILEVHAHRQMSLLSDATFDEACAGIRGILAAPWARATWPFVRTFFTPTDARLIESSVINDVPLRQPVDDIVGEVRKARDALLAART